CDSKLQARRYELLPEIHSAIQHALRNLPFRGFGHAYGFFGGEDCYCISFRVEADAFARDIVDHNRIQGFRNELLSRILNYVLSFSREADDNLRSLTPRDFRKDVDCWCQL